MKEDVKIEDGIPIPDAKAEEETGSKSPEAIAFTAAVEKARRDDRAIKLEEAPPEVSAPPMHTKDVLKDEEIARLRMELENANLRAQLAEAKAAAVPQPVAAASPEHVDSVDFWLMSLAERKPVDHSETEAIG